MQKVSFTVDGQKLVGTIFYPENLKEQNPAILFMHGWTGARERNYQYAKALSKLGFICLVFDMRGHGESEGDIKTFTIRDFLTDALAAYDYLLKVDGVDRENISAVGSSFGSYLISLLSEKRKVKNLALRVPADYKNQDFDKSKMQASGSDNPVIAAWRRQTKKLNETYALAAINKYEGNILIMEAEKDHIVPHETIENYINAINDKTKLTHVLMKDAPHSIKEGRFRDEVTNILTDWFKTKI